jgi:hypothetical protein
VSGVRVIYGLLSTYALGSPTVVASASIKAGDLPINTPLPAISITHVSSVQRLTLAMTEANRMHTDRVQVTWMVKNQQGYPQGSDYPLLVTLGAWILAACPNQHGTVNGVNVDSILPDSEGPDLPLPDESILTRSRDFIVRWIG